MRLPWKQNQPGRKSELVMWEIRWETLSPDKIKKTAKTVRKLLQKKFVWCVFIIESHHSHGRGEVVKFDWKLFLKWKVPQGGCGGGRGCFSCESFLRWKLIIKLLTEFGCKIVWRRTWKEEKISVVIGMQTFQVKNLIILQSRINLAYCDRTGHCKPLLILSNLNSPPISHWVICAQKKVLKAIKVDFELCVSPIFIAIIALTRFIYLISISRVCRCAACHLLSIANLYKTVLKKIITKLCELCL